ncbi:hypothetical protein N7451_012814 [Penicillium sp. IBT 35674x]|nr:hypothetical protein N7451_012814 [Penicillium sp. IBT 35674x]
MPTPPPDAPELGKPQFESHSWLEPLIVVTIMIGSLYLNRRKSYKIFGSHATIRYSRGERPTGGTLNTPNNGFLERNTVFGFQIRMADSTQWAHHIHSRLLWKFPFLVEMFYWIVNYLFYSVTRAVSQTLLPANVGIVEVAQKHGEDILNFEHASTFSFLFPIQESAFQSYFMANHPFLMTFFNRIYSIVHIPGTVLFLGWYYHEAPNSETFASVRRTMTMGNLVAFVIFCLYPCMPPRLLPESWGFYDTVRQEHAESLWVDSKSVNQFAAMPSLHFTYAFCIGSTMLYHSETGRWITGKPVRKAIRSRIFYASLALVYSCLVLSVIVATANHYWLDAIVAMLSVTVCFCFNRILLLLLPLEFCVCWALRVTKPVPNIGKQMDDMRAEDLRSYRLISDGDIA